MCFHSVVGWLGTIGFCNLTDHFRTNAVDGEFLGELSEDELVTELALTKLQAKKVMIRFAAA